MPKGHTNNPGGRPPIPEGERSVKQTLYLHEKRLEKLKGIASSRGVSMSKVVSDLIDAAAPRGEENK